MLSRVYSILAAVLVVIDMHHFDQATSSGSIVLAILAVAAREQGAEDRGK